MAELSTTYMGLKLRNPIIVGSCDLTASVKGVLRCEEAGAGAVVLKSVFEEQFLGEVKQNERSYPIYPEAYDYLESGGLLEYTSRKTVELIEEVKKRAKIPVIASINCRSTKLWPAFARHFQDAGADGLELNIYFLPVDLKKAGEEYERFHIEILEKVKKAVSIPVAVKLSSHLTSVPHLSYRLSEAGCSGLVLFNWFLQPDIDLERFKTINIRGAADFNESLRWVALLAGRVRCDIAASGGVLSAGHVIKQVLAGASAVQVCTLFYKKGLAALKDLLSGFQSWMEEHRFSSLDDFKGELSFREQELSLKEPRMAEAFFRAQYMKFFLKK